ncbi:MerR family DNA-binding transcriptional regulator [Leucobacter chromiireducens]
MSSDSSVVEVEGKMRIGELARRAGVSVKAVRYYEEIGLLAPERDTNGYRDFDGADLRAVQEIRALAELGIAPSRAAPFVECLSDGHEHGDECVSSLAAYRDAIAELDRAIAELSARRSELALRLDRAAGRGFAAEAPVAEPTAGEPPAPDYTVLPPGLPQPEDDGAARHVPGLPLPDLTLGRSDGGRLSLAGLGTGRTIIYAYPLSGRPGTDLPDGWDAIPGARGCSTEACDFRDHFTELQEAGAARVFGLSSQDPDYQAELCERLRLPFPMLSDPELRLADALRLPTFAAPGHPRLFARITLVVRDGRVEHVFYPIFPPNTHAQQVLAWLRDHPEEGE